MFEMEKTCRNCRFWICKKVIVRTSVEMGLCTNDKCIEQLSVEVSADAFIDRNKSPLLFHDGFGCLFFEEKPVCHCGGECIRSTGIVNEWVGTSEWPDGDMAGATLGPSSEGTMVNCWKCRDCGHSFT
jgi:hypothetical protein